MSHSIVLAQGDQWTCMVCWFLLEMSSKCDFWGSDLNLTLDQTRIHKSYLFHTHFIMIASMKCYQAMITICCRLHCSAKGVSRLLQINRERASCRAVSSKNQIHFRSRNIPTNRFRSEKSHSHHRHWNPLSNSESRSNWMNSKWSLLIFI